MGNNWKDIMVILLVVAILVILMRMSKVMQLQSETLLGVATKLGVAPPKRKKEIEEDEDEDEPDPEELEEEDEEEETEESEAEEVEAEEINEKGEIIITEHKPKLVSIQAPKHEVPSTPKKSRQEIMTMILNLFEDGKPRKRKEIEDALNIQNVRTGYMSDVISTMRDKEALGAQFVDLGDKWKSYYIFGLPDWFNKNKLKTEYAKKFNS